VESISYNQILTLFRWISVMRRWISEGQLLRRETQSRKDNQTIHEDSLSLIYGWLTTDGSEITVFVGLLHSHHCGIPLFRSIKLLTVEVFRTAVFGIPCFIQFRTSSENPDWERPLIGSRETYIGIFCLIARRAFGSQNPGNCRGTVRTH
jgi:hypothetical protein